MQCPKTKERRANEKRKMDEDVELKNAAKDKGCKNSHVTLTLTYSSTLCSEMSAF
jgi:hypothetical protein